MRPDPITRTSVIGELLPGDVAASETATAAPDDALFAAELALIDGAISKRRTEFATARHCARSALAALDIAPAPILRGPSREPLWPEGIVGSITHCASYHAAAVGRTTQFCSIGIDAEIDEPLPAGLLEHISLPAERAQLQGTSETHLDRLLFSAKEAVYKTWFPLTRRWLDFDDAMVTLRPNGTFKVQILTPPLPTVLPGRWLARDGLILTAMALPISPRFPATIGTSNDASACVSAPARGVLLR